MFGLVWVLQVLAVLQAVLGSSNFYDSNKNIIELDSGNFNKLIHKTNYTSIVEFYAPWCGYCRQLEPIYKKVGKKLDGVAQVGAVNCDLEKNKRLCAEYNVQGFPTLMVFRPPKIDISKPASERMQFTRHTNELFVGERKLTPIVDFTLTRIKSYVSKIKSVRNLEDTIHRSRLPINVVLFSKKEKVFPSQKSMAIDWLGLVSVGTMPNTRIKTMEISANFTESYPNISKYLNTLLPAQKKNDNSTLVIFDRNNDAYYEYSGDSFTKTAITKFIANSCKIKPQEGPLSRRQALVDRYKLKWNKKSSKIKDGL